MGWDLRAVRSFLSMAGPDPAIQLVSMGNVWMPGSRPGMESVLGLRRMTV